MRVLDIDLDFFLNDVPYYRAKTDGRISADDYSPWPATAVEEFLAQKCGLGLHNPIPGKVITHHDEAFYIWKELIQNRKLTSPFEVVHVDSHADLGSGDAGYIYLMGDLLHRAPSARTDPDSGIDKMNCANFLAFAIACRWIDRLTYVHHPNGGDDLFEWYFKDGDSRSCSIQLKAVDPSFFESLTTLEPILDMRPTEPTVPFRKIAPDEFSDKGDFDFVVLCHSPPFTPKESDDLIPLIARYMLLT